MTKAWCIRADFGTFTHQFRGGGYAAIGWQKIGDLSGIATREDLYPRYRAAFPEDKSNIVVGIQVGQIARFMLEIAPGDIVITWLYQANGPVRSAMGVKKQQGRNDQKDLFDEALKTSLRHGVSGEGRTGTGACEEQQAHTAWAENRALTQHTHATLQAVGNRRGT